MTDNAIIEAAARALRELRVPEEEYAAVFILDIITPLIRAAALEEAALIIEARLLLMDNLLRDISTVRDGAAAIRILKEQPGALAKRPVAWRVKDYADGWIIFQDEETADYEAQRTGAVMQGLYVRDGTLP